MSKIHVLVVAGFKVVVEEICKKTTLYLCLQNTNGIDNYIIEFDINRSCCLRGCCIRDIITDFNIMDLDVSNDDIDKHIDYLPLEDIQLPESLVRNIHEGNHFEYEVVDTLKIGRRDDNGESKLFLEINYSKFISKDDDDGVPYICGMNYVSLQHLHNSGSELIVRGYFEVTLEEYKETHIILEDSVYKILYKVKLYEIKGLCPSGCALATYGNIDVNIIDESSLIMITHIPSSETRLSIDLVHIDKDIEDYECEIFRFSKVGIDMYYPLGYVIIDYSKFVAK